MTGIAKASVSALNKVPPGFIASLPMRHADSYIHRIAINVHKLRNAEPALLEMFSRCGRVMQAGRESQRLVARQEMTEEYALQSADHNR